MTNDAVLLGRSDEEFIKLIEDALKYYKEEKQSDLEKSDLAYCSLVFGCLFTGETPKPRWLALGVVALLRWAVKQLWPSTNPDKNERGWKLYAVLYYPYLERKDFEWVTDLLELPSTKTIFNHWRPGALKAVAEKLREELQHPAHLQERIYYAIQERYHAYQADEQRFLRFCALLRQPMPVDRLKEVSKKLGITQLNCIPSLVLDGWLVQEGEMLATSLRDAEARSYLHNELNGEERCDWCNYLGELYAMHQEYIQAASYYCLSEHVPAATSLLIEHYSEIVDAGQIKKLYELYKCLDLAALDKNTLARLQIAMGRAALSVENIDEAKRFLYSALSIQDNLLKAKAYYYLGQALQNAVPSEALKQFDRGIELLDTLNLNQQGTVLLADLYIAKAWLYILWLPDLGKAEALLKQAEKLITKTDSTRQTDLQRAWGNFYNAQGGRYAEQKQPVQEQQAYEQAVMAARESGDQELLWKVLHNLAQAYIHAKLYVQGLELLEEARTIVEQLDNQDWLGKCDQTCGAAYCLQGQYGLAISHYKTAESIYEKTGNDHWRAATYADLAEAYEAFPNLTEARAYYKKAGELATRAQAEDVLQTLKKLKEKKRVLTADLDPDQLKSLEIVKGLDCIKPAELRKEIGLSKGKMRGDLTKLVNLGLLVRKGSGPSTTYSYPKDQE